MKNKMLILIIPILLFAACSPKAPASWQERIKYIENNVTQKNALPPWTKRTLPEAMNQYGVPGLSIAVFDNNELVWARGYGELERDSGIPVTTESLFPALGISAMISRFIALALVQEGKICWDKNITHYLTSWHVPVAENIKDSTLTLGDLLRFNWAGLNFFPIPTYTTDEVIPTLLESLTGRNPAKNPPVRMISEPGNYYREKNGNLSLVSYIVLQQLLEDVAQRSFSQLAAETILFPLGMKHSNFEQPQGEEVLNVASGHNRDGVIPGKRQIFPTQAARGLWSTPSDLSLFFIETSRVIQGQSGKILSTVTLGKMINPNSSCRQLSSSGTGFSCTYRYNPKLGQGIVIMTNNEQGGILSQEILHSVIKESKWNWCDSPLRESIFTNFILIIAIALLGLVLILGGFLLFLRREKN